MSGDGKEVVEAVDTEGVKSWLREGVSTESLQLSLSLKQGNSIISGVLLIASDGWYLLS